MKRVKESYIYISATSGPAIIITISRKLSFRFAVTPCVYLNYRKAEVQVLKRTLSHNSYSRLSLSEIIVRGRTNIRQLVSQLSLSEKYGSG